MIYSPTTSTELAVIIDYNENNDKYKIIDWDGMEKWAEINISCKIHPMMNNIDDVSSLVAQLTNKQIAAVIWAGAQREKKIINEKDKIIKDLKLQLKMK